MSKRAEVTIDHLGQLLGVGEGWDECHIGTSDDGRTLVFHFSTYPKPSSAGVKKPQIGGQATFTWPGGGPSPSPFVD